MQGFCGTCEGFHLEKCRKLRIYMQHSKRFSHASCITRHSRVQRWPHTSLLHFTSLHSLHLSSVQKLNLKIEYSFFFFNGIEILAVPWNPELWPAVFTRAKFSFSVFVDCIFISHIRIHFLNFTFTFTCHFSFRSSPLTSFKTAHITHHTSHY